MNKLNKIKDSNYSHKNSPAQLSKNPLSSLISWGNLIMDL